MPFVGTVVMIVGPIALGVLLGRSRGWPRRWLRAIGQFKGLELLAAAAVVKALFVGDVLSLGPSGFRLQVALTALLGLLFVLLNRAVPVAGAPVALAVGALGALANAVVQFSHNAMPFSRTAALWAGYSAEEVGTPHYGYVSLRDGDSLGLLLGDVIPVPLLHRVLSVGDLALMAGLALLARALSSHGRSARTRAHASRGLTPAPQAGSSIWSKERR